MKSITDETASTDTSNQAIAVARELPHAKERTLTECGFTVATEYVVLSADAAAPPEPWQGLFILSEAEAAEQHRLLTIKRVRIADTGEAIAYEQAADRTGSVNRKVLYTQTDSDIEVEYTAFVDSADLPSPVVELFVWRLIEALAMPLTGQESYVQLAVGMGERAKKAALATMNRTRSRRGHLRVPARHSAIAQRNHGPRGEIEGEAP